MKKRYYCLLWIFQSMISFHELKLGLNKSMQAADDKQGINNLRPYWTSGLGKMNE